MLSFKDASIARSQEATLPDLVQGGVGSDDGLGGVPGTAEVRGQP